MSLKIGVSPDTETAAMVKRETLLQAEYGPETRWMSRSTGVNSR
jgi:hypothetical protein